MKLADESLLREAVPVGDRWLHAAMGDALVVRNPATGEQLGVVPRLGAHETRTAIEAARVAQIGWSRRPAHERARLLRRWFDLVMANQDDLATILTCEQGKPLAEARAEIAYGASFIEWFAEEARRVQGDIVPAHRIDSRILITKQPIGVVGAITPWNFPCAMVTRKVAPALAAGCSLVLKPASQTPFSAIALAVLAERAGLPPGLLSVLTGPAGEIGGELTANPAVRKLTFTGSTEVGIQLYGQSAPTIKKLALELGGNAPFIVFDDADLDAAVAGLLVAKFRNSGQTCVCANRIFVQAGIYDAFATKLRTALDGLRIGNGMDEGVQIGPLIDIKAVEKVEEHIADAVGQGARVTFGGQRHTLGGSFFEPTILSDVTDQMLITREETFGPIAPLYRFVDEAEVIARANDTEFGLASYFYARDVARIIRVSESLEYGMVGINTGLISTAEAPFGGIKQSGLGREGSRYGIEEFVELKYLCVGGLS